MFKSLNTSNIIIYIQRLSKLPKKVIDTKTVLIAHNTNLKISRIEQTELNFPSDNGITITNNAITIAEFLNNSMCPAIWREFKKSVNNIDA